MSSSPKLLEESSLLELAIKQAEWPPARWLWREAKVGSKVQMRVGRFDMLALSLMYRIICPVIV